MLQLVLFFWLLLSKLVAQVDETPEDYSLSTSLADLENLLPTTVQSISVITGELTENEMDFAIAGPEPLTLNRCYSYNHAPLTDKSDKKLETPPPISNFNCGHKWYFNRPSFLYLISTEQKEYKLHAFVNLDSGARTTHEIITSEKEIWKKALNLPVKKMKGLHNCLSHEISARTNLNNLSLLVDLPNNNCKTKSGGGSTTHFVWKEDKFDFGKRIRASFETKPNGNIFQFTKKGIHTYNSTKTVCYNWVNFHYPKDNQLHLNASDGKKASYYFEIRQTEEPIEPLEKIPSETSKNYEKREKKHQEKIRKKYLLKKAEYSHKPHVEYDYNPVGRLKSKQFPENRTVQFQYYEKGNNEVDGVTTVKIKDHENFRVGKIKEKLAPVGSDATPIITHRFVYDMQRHNLKERNDYSGSTTVYDAYLHKTIFHYNRNHQLSKYEKFLQNELYCKEIFIWNDVWNDALFPSSIPNSDMEVLLAGSPKKPLQSPKKKLEEIRQDPFKYAFKKLHDHGLISLKSATTGNLKGKFTQDANGIILEGRFFDYDDLGNIKADTLYGNLSGTNSQPIVLDEHQYPSLNGIEHYSKRFTYSADGLNLVLSEEHDNGKKITLTYKPGTDLVVSKILFNQTEVCCREFFEYDTNTTVITKIIKDNGQGTNQDDLTGVTERLITRITPRQTTPLGLPEKIDELYLDLESGQEILLKRVLYTEYTQEGYLKKQDHYDSNGIYRYSLEWDYDKHGNVIFEKNALGHVITKTYDSNDNLKTEQGPNPDYYLHYIYDYSNRLIKTEKIHKNGIVFTETYEYDYLGNKTAAIDRFGRKTQYIYDDLNRHVKTIFPQVGNDQPTTNLISYDIFNRPINATNANGYTTSTNYNSYGKPTKVQYADGTVETYEYYLDGTLAKSIAKNGAITLYERDSLGRVIQEDIQGLGTKTNVYYGKKLISSTDLLGVETTYEYDFAGRLIKTIHGKTQTENEYDSLGRISKTKEWFGYGPTDYSVNAFEYDYLNRVIEERIEDSNRNILKKSNFDYDVQGNKTKIIEGKSITQTVYNSDNLPIKIIHADGYETHFSYAYNKVLNVIATDPAGRTMTLIYDELDRKTTILKKDPFGYLLSRQDILYDGVGNQIKVIDTVISNENSQYKIFTEWKYNEVNEEISLTEALGTPEQKISRTKYNKYGQKEEIIKPDGIILFHTYDDQGRLFTLISSDKTISYQYEYEADNQVKKVIDHIHHNENIRVYDEIGNLKQEILGNELSFHYSLDRMGRITHLDLPDKTGVDYVFDALNLKEVHRIKNGKKIYSHLYQDYDEVGNLHSAQTLSGPISYQYDKSNRLIQIETSNWTQTIPEEAFDNLGRIRNYEIREGNEKTNYNFDYDDLDHLISENGHRYHCDSLSNRLSKDQIRYNVNALNQLTHQGGWDYKYDLNGNLIEKKNKTVTITFTYDALNRMTSVLTNGKTIQYQYDSFGRRLKKDDTKYLYQGLNEVGAVKEDRIQELRILGVGIEAEMGSAIAIELRDHVYTPLHDHNGNLTCLLDGDQLLESYRYTAFGEKKILFKGKYEVTESILSNPWGYASKRFDVETGFVYFGMRYYDPEVGSWMTPDPLGYADGPNLYAYLKHTPLQIVDPFGLSAEAGTTLHFPGSYSLLPDVEVESWPAPKFDFKAKTLPQDMNWYDPGCPYCNPNFFTTTRYYTVGPRCGDLGISFMNGICNTFWDARSSLDLITNGTNGINRYMCYGATAGISIDIARSSLELAGHDTKRVLELRKMFVAALKENRYLLHYCHSEGCIVTRNALRGLPEELRNRIIVEAFAPAGYIPEYLAREVRHYRSARDIVPRLDIVGEIQCRHNIVTFKPHPKAALNDHTFSSPTFRDTIIRRRDVFIETYKQK